MYIYRCALDVFIVSLKKQTNKLSTSIIVRVDNGGEISIRKIYEKLTKFLFFCFCFFLGLLLYCSYQAFASPKKKEKKFWLGRNKATRCVSKVEEIPWQ